MTAIATAEFGECLREFQARRFLERWRLAVTSNRGVLIFRYPGQDERRVLPVYIHGQGWFYVKAELEREWVKLEPEQTLQEAGE